ncbi:unnamed protein product, partial [Didymodactylos carnosus]
DICLDEWQNSSEKCYQDLISQIDRFKRVECEHFERYLALVNESLSGIGLFLTKHRQAEMENDLITFQKELDYLIIDLQMTSNSDTKSVQFKNYFYSLNGLDFKHMRQIGQSNNIDNTTIMAASSSSILFCSPHLNLLQIYNDNLTMVNKFYWPWKRAGQLVDVKWFDLFDKYLILVQKSSLPQTKYLFYLMSNETYVVDLIYSLSSSQGVGDKVAGLTTFNCYVLVAYNNDEQKTSYLQRIEIKTKKRLVGNMETEPKKYLANTNQILRYKMADSIVKLCSNKYFVVLLLSNPLRLEIRSEHLTLINCLYLDVDDMGGQIMGISSDQRFSFILILDQQLISFDQNGFICFYNYENDENETILNGIIYKQNQLVVKTTKQLKIYELCQKY